MRIGNANITFRPGTQFAGGPTATAHNDFGSMLNALLNAGTHGAPLHDLVSVTTNMWGDGGSGNEGGMDALLSRLMAQYEPHSVATARATREALPKLRVAPRVAAHGGEEDPSSASAEQIGKQQAGEQRYAAAHAGETCAVCFEEWDEGAEVTELPCKHCFCHECIGRWLETHNTCPTCRLALPTDDPDYEVQRAQPGQHTSNPVPSSSASTAQGGRGMDNVHPALASGYDSMPDSPMTQHYLQRMEESQQRVAVLRGSMQDIQVGGDTFFDPLQSDFDYVPHFRLLDDDVALEGPTPGSGEGVAMGQQQPGAAEQHPTN